MAALERDEIEVGLVVWLNQEALHRDHRVTATAPAGDERRGPFVCCHADLDVCGWAAVTSRDKHERLELLPEWRSGGTRDWTGRRQFLNDGNNVLVGQPAAFVDASVDERTSVGNRARLSDVGVAAVVGEIRRQVHRRAPGTEHVGRGWTLPNPDDAST